MEEQPCKMNFIKVDNFKIPQIGLGMYPIAPNMVNSTLEEALKDGYTLIDTAYKYGNEKEIGKYIHKKEAENVLIQTKFSIIQIMKKKFCGIPYYSSSLDKEYKKSSKKLKKNPLDIYLLHSPSPGYLNNWGRLVKLKNENKVKTIGVCHFNIKQLTDIFDRYGQYPAINQIEVHPYNNNRELIEFCKEKKIAVEARSILMHGDYNSLIQEHRLLDGIAREYGKSIPQILIKWIIQQELIAIVKSSNPIHLKQNIDVFDFQLTKKQMDEIFSLNRNFSVGFKKQ